MKKSDANLKERPLLIQSGWEHAPLGEGVRKAFNLLLIGHGAALLLIFNAQIDANVQMPLKTSAWLCAVGLIAAFVGVLSAHYYDDLLALPMRPGETEQARWRHHGKAMGSIVFCILVSPGLFVWALINAIEGLPR